MTSTSIHGRSTGGDYFVHLALILRHFIFYFLVKVTLCKFKPIPDRTQPQSKTPPYSSETERRLKMGRRRPSKLGDSVPLEEELREQEEV